jgi:hypothetical protein
MSQNPSDATLELIYANLKLTVFDKPALQHVVK